jgi:hypothetical protein
MKVLSYIISLIFLWSTGAMAFAPGFLQVAGGGGAVSSCDSGIVVNGCFDNGDTGWTYDAGASFSVAGGVATLGNNGGSYKIAYSTTSPSIQTGLTYNWSINITANSGIYRVVIGAVDVIIDNSTGLKSGSVLTTNNWIPLIKVDTAAGTDYVSFDNLKVWIP